MHHPTDRIAHTTAFDKPVVEHWLEREIAQWVHTMKDRSDDPSHHERTLSPRSYISLLQVNENTSKFVKRKLTCFFLLHIVAFLVCLIIYANGRLACLMLACRQNTLQVSWTSACYNAWSRPLYHELLLTHLGFIITESVHKLFLIVCGRTVYMHDVLTSGAF